MGKGGSEGYLVPGEAVVRICRRHPVVLFVPFLKTLMLSAIGLVFIAMSGGGGGGSTLGRFTLLVAVGYFGWMLWEWARTRYVITTMRVISEKGVVIQEITTVPFSKVTDTSFRRSLIARALDYGDILLDCSGRNPGKVPITRIPKVEEVFQLIESLRLTGKAPTAPLEWPQAHRHSRSRRGRRLTPKRS